MTLPVRPLLGFLLALSLPAVAGTRLVPAFAQHVPGANGSYWQSEIRLYNPTAQPATVTLANAFPYNGTTCAGFAPITIQPGHLAQIRNGVCNDGGAAALELSCDDSIDVTSLITNVGSTTQALDCCLAGFTEAIPVLSVATAYRAQQTISNVQVTGIPTSSRLTVTRHNLGFVNPSDAPLSVTLNYFGPNGEPGPLFQYRVVILPPHSLTQINDALAESPLQITGPPRINGYFRLEAAAEGAFFIYDSVVDNATNDATFWAPR